VPASAPLSATAPSFGWSVTRTSVQLVAAEAEERTAIAEQRGFAPGQELDDWLVAEAAVARAEQQPRVKNALQIIQAKSMS
jgi:DUF2934 family protein